MVMNVVTIRGFVENVVETSLDAVEPRIICCRCKFFLDSSLELRVLLGVCNDELLQVFKRNLLDDFVGFHVWIL